MSIYNRFVYRVGLSPEANDIISMWFCRGSGLRILHEGPCALPNEANKFYVSSEDTEEVPTSASCNMLCPANYVPVCGSDGRTYGNPCSFDAAKCM